MRTRKPLNGCDQAGAITGRPRFGRRFVQKTFALGAEEQFPWEKAMVFADAIEDEETVRKLIRAGLFRGL